MKSDALELIMTTMVSIEIVRAFFNPSEIVRILGDYPSGYLSLESAVQRWWFYPGLTKKILNDHDGDAEDHSAISRFCERFVSTRHKGLHDFIKPHQAWLARRIVLGICP